MLLSPLGYAVTPALKGCFNTDDFVTAFSMQPLLFILDIGTSVSGVNLMLLCFCQGNVRNPFLFLYSQGSPGTENGLDSSLNE